MLKREKLVPRNERARKLREIRRQPLVRVIERVSREERIVRREIVVYPRLKEVLDEFLREAEVEGRQPASEVRSIGQRKLVQVGA